MTPSKSASSTPSAAPWPSSETSLRDVLLFTFDEINAKGGVLGQEDRTRRRRRRLELAALRGKGQAAPRAGQGRRHLRLLDLGQPQVGASGLREEQGPALLPGAVRGRGTVPEHLLHRRGREPAGHAGGRLPPRGGQEEVLPARHRTTSIRRPPTSCCSSISSAKACRSRTSAAASRRTSPARSSRAGKYTPFGHTDYQQIVAEIKQFAAGGDACVINTLNGDTNVPFFKEYAAAGLTAETCPVVSFSISEDEFRGLPAKQARRPARLLDLLPVDQHRREQEVRRGLPELAQEDERARHREGRPRDLLADGAQLQRRLSLEEGGREGQELSMWRRSSRRSKTGISFDGPGGKVTTQKNHHLTKNVYIGETKADGQFKILEAFDNVVGEPFLKGTFKDSNRSRAIPVLRQRNRQGSGSPEGPRVRKRFLHLLPPRAMGSFGRCDCDSPHGVRPSR